MALLKAGSGAVVQAAPRLESGGRISYLVRVRRAACVLPNLAFAGLMVLAAACAREPERPNVVVVVIDTLRRDALGTYGDRDASTPHLDRVAAEGAVFDAARATAPWTIPSMASLLTSRLP